MAHIPDEELRKTITFLNDIAEFGGTISHITRNIAATNVRVLESYLEKPAEVPVVKET
jgi:hypothetical protein